MQTTGARALARARSRGLAGAGWLSRPLHLCAPLLAGAAARGARVRGGGVVGWRCSVCSGWWRALPRWRLPPWLSLSRS